MGGLPYRISFFLQEFLRETHDISVDVVVGYVNDGESDIMASHAWLEYNGKKIDLGLTLTADPQIQPPGKLLILDREVTAASGKYTYHLQKSATARAAEASVLSNPTHRSIVTQQEEQHKLMERIASDPKKVRSYPDGAPDGLGYNEFARMVTNKNNRNEGPPF